MWEFEEGSGGARNRRQWAGNLEIEAMLEAAAATKRHLYQAIVAPKWHGRATEKAGGDISRWRLAFA